MKKLLAMRNACGLVVMGLLFAGIGLVVFFGGAAGGDLVPLVFAAIGIVLLVIGVLQVVRELKAPVSDKAQYDRVDLAKAPAMQEQAAQATQISKGYSNSDSESNSDSTLDEEFEEFVYHFTGKLNQSQVMKTMDGEVVYEAICDKMTMVKDTAYEFVDHISGQKSTRMISHMVTMSAGIGDGFSANLSSGFDVDSVPVWDLLAQMGYGFAFSMKGIYRVKCKRSDIPGLFLICFALSRTDETLS